MDASDFIFKSCLTFVFGVLIGAKFDLGSLWVFFFLFLFSLALLLSVLKQRRKILFFSLLLLPLGLGTARIDRAQRLARRPDLTPYFGKEVEVEARVVSEPEVSTHKQEFRALIPALEAETLVEAPLYPLLHFGDRFRFRGRLEKPESGSDFDYRAYLRRQGVHFVTSRPHLLSLEEGEEGISPKKWALGFREALEGKLEETASFPQAGFFKALLFGSEEGISSFWKKKLNRTGTRHIVAISGANITILSGLVMNFLLALGFWRHQAIFLAMAFVLLYVLMIGCPASGVRAGMMGTLFLLAQKTGRVPDSERLAGFTLFLMLLFSPLLVFDVGFQLSFLAFLGLVYLSPLLSRALRGVPSFLGARENLASTLAAQGLVLPLLLFNFGRLSLVSPLANVLILPVLPFLTLSAFVFSSLSFFSDFLASLLYLLPHFLLTLLMKVVDLCSRLPGASVEVSLPWWGLALSYLLIFASLLYFKIKSSPLK